MTERLPKQTSKDEGVEIRSPRMPLRESDSLAHLENGRYVANRQELKRISILRQEYRVPLKDVKNDLKNYRQPGEKVSGRLKGEVSIVNKIGNRIGKGAYPDATVGTVRTKMQDIAGTKIVVPTIKRKEEVYEGLIQEYKGRIISVDRYDKNPKFGYYGINMTVEDKGHPVEIQIKTKNDEKYANIVHPPIPDKTNDLYKGPRAKEPETQAFIENIGDYHHMMDLRGERPET